MKTIKTTHIDTGSHGYLSVSQKDFMLVMFGELDQISGYSGINRTRVFLEEDCDAGMFIERAQDRGFKVDIKHSYNPKHNITHNYKPEFVGFNFEVDDCFKFHNDRPAQIVENGSRIIAISDGKQYSIPKTNPFQYVKEIVNI